MLPSGTVTFLFTDIVGSTAKWEADPTGMSAALAEHNKALDLVMARHKGHIFKTIGDAYCVAFGSAESAVSAAEQAHQILTEVAPTILIRIGLHTGAIVPTDEDYFGPPVNKAARIQALASGGQTLLSAATKSLLPTAIPVKSLGEHLLKDLLAPTEIWQTGVRDFAPIRSLSNIQTNLPIQGNTFVGRQVEIMEVSRRLKGSRLVTLTGAGGTGKTRLALQVAAQLPESFPDGVWFIEFASLLDRSAVAREVAVTLAVADGTDTEDVRIAMHLQRQRALLILDNCEHVLPEAADLCEKLLSKCPNVVVMVTSREPLGARGEQIYAVPSLDAPTLAQAHTVQDLTQYGATALFLDRLAMVAPNYTVTLDQVLIVRNICARLDGIPFAIELAAARGRSMAINEIEKRLDDRFRLLTGGSRTAVSRQQTLRAMIDWSVQLLTEDQQKLFVSLSVFVGGWTLDTAEQVCGFEDTGIDPLDVVDLLSALVDKSLVEFNPDTGRYKLLETVRHYALELLEKMPWAVAIRSRHAHVFVDLVSGEREDSFQRFYEEIENYQAGIEWLLTDVREVSVVRESLGETGSLWYAIRRWDDFLHLSESLQTMAEGVLDRSDVAAIRNSVRSIRIMRRDADSDRLLEEMLRDHATMDKDWQDRYLGWIHYVLFFMGRTEEAVKSIEATPSEKLTGLSCNALANCYFCMGKYDEAVLLFDQAAEMALKRRNWSNRQTPMNSAAEVRAVQGDLRDCWDRTLASLRENSAHGLKVRCGSSQIAALSVASQQVWSCALTYAIADQRRLSRETMNDPFDLKMLDFAQEIVRPLITDELIAQAAQALTRSDRSAWLRSLLDVQIDDICGEVVTFPNPHLLPQPL